MSLEEAFETGRLRQPLEDIATAMRANAYAQFASLPGLREFWPMTVTNDDGDAIGFFGNSLLAANTPLFNAVANSAHVELDGSSSYFYQVDGPFYDVIGTETYIDTSIRGLTLGGWFRHNSLSNNQVYISKENDALLAYTLFMDDTLEDVRFSVDDGGGSETVFGDALEEVSTWVFVVGRFDPASSLAVFQNETKTEQSTTMAAIQNSAAQFRIGAGNTTAPDYLNGQASMCFLCAAALSDDLIGSLFQSSRKLFGV